MRVYQGSPTPPFSPASLSLPLPSLSLRSLVSPPLFSPLQRDPLQYGSKIGD